VQNPQERPRRPEVTVVTTAARSHSEDIVLRQRRYLMTQSVRVACLLLAATLPIPLVWKGAFIVGAVVLPYFGVVMANAGPSRDRRRPVRHAVEPAARLEISPGRVVEAD
jgi:hypothetical protein